MVVKRWREARNKGKAKEKYQYFLISPIRQAFLFLIRHWLQQSDSESDVINNLSFYFPFPNCHHHKYSFGPWVGWLPCWLLPYQRPNNFAFEMWRFSQGRIFFFWKIIFQFNYKFVESSSSYIIIAMLHYL